MQYLSANWADVLAWAVILGGLVACASLLARRDRPRPPAPTLTVIEPDLDLAATAGPRRLGPTKEWELVVRRVARDLERGAALAALQSRAAVKVAAAEHGYNRLAADCARLFRTSAEPTVVATAHQLAAAPRKPPRTLERPAEHHPLAA